MLADQAQDTLLRTLNPFSINRKASGMFPNGTKCTDTEFYMCHGREIVCGVKKGGTKTILDLKTNLNSEKMKATIGLHTKQK